MKVLLDHDVPHSLRPQFPEECEVVTAHYQGWAGHCDDELLKAAEEEFDALVTLDTNLVHQQNVRAYEIGIVVIDVHPIVPGHLEKQMSKVRSALRVAADEQRAVAVHEDGIVFLFP